MLKQKLLSTTLVGGLGGLFLAVAPVQAQDQAAAPPTPPAPPAAAEPAKPPNSNELLVTGSRIRRSNFSAPAPIQVITVEETKQEGRFSATDILQKSSVAAGSVQINAQFGGFVVNGGSGVDTVSLRGLGSQRTLVLLNGRRLNPAGVSGTVAAVDLNVIPDNLVERYEILKDGASSIYGSDAIGGVVNIITRDRYDGIAFEVDGASPIRGPGGEYSVSISGGRVRDRYHVLFGLEYDQQDPVQVGDLPGGKCPLELQKLPSGTTYDFGRSYANGAPYCANTQTDFVTTLSDGATWIFDPSLPTSFQFVPFQQDPFGTVPRHTNIPTDPNDAAVDALSGSRRYSGTLIGGFDITPSVELYFEGLLTNRNSQQAAFVPQFFPADFNTIIAASFSPYNPFPDFVQPLVTLPVSNFSQNVTAGRAMIGLKGDFKPLPGWKWDVSATYGESSADYTAHPQLASRVANALDVVPAPVGFDQTLVRTSPVDGVGYTCSINLTSPGERCYPLNWFIGTKAMVGDAALKYISSTEVGHTNYKQVIATATMDGPIFKLPAGPLQGVIGFEFRYDRLNDNPGPEAVASNYFNLSTSGITQGDESVFEGYGELEAPILKGKPLVESLTLNGSVRYTHYRTAGDDWTFKGTANWQIIPSFRVRGTYGTSFRGPALFENYLAAQTSFTGALDPCQNYGNGDPNSQVYKNCASEGLATNFPGYSSTPEVFARGALGRLKPETSKNYTVGGILQPTFADLQVELDYFHIEVNNEIAQLGPVNLLNLCYDSTQFRAGSPYCSFISARDANGDIAQIDDSFLNVARETTSGLDLTVLYRKEFSFGRVRLHGEATYRIEDTQELVPGLGATDFNGTFGQPRLVFNTDARFYHGNWEFLWSTTFLSKQEAYSLTGETPGGRYLLHQPSQLYHTLSVSYNGDKWRATLGVRNITDKYPPVISNNPDTAFAPRVGEFANGYGNLELFGRTVFFNLKKEF